MSEVVDISGSSDGSPLGATPLRQLKEKFGFARPSLLELRSPHTQHRLRCLTQCQSLADAELGEVFSVVSLSRRWLSPSDHAYPAQVSALQSPSSYAACSSKYTATPAYNLF